MAVNIGPKIGIDGEAEYRSQLNNIIQQAKTLDSEMKALQSSFDEQNKSQEDAIKEAELYNRQIEVQQERVAKLAEMVEKSSQLTGENSTETLKWREALANAQTELNKMQVSEEENVSWLDKLKQKVSEAGPAIESGIVNTAKAAAAALAAVTAATVAVVAEVGKGIVELSEYGDHIDKASQKMGISAEAYQEWDFVLQHCGSSIDAMKTGMTRLEAAVIDNKDAFQKLGISQQEVANMSKEDLFAATITGLQNVKDETERSAIATELFGKSYTELAPLLNTTAEETKEMIQTVHDLGGVMSDEAVKQSAAFQDQLLDLQTAMNGLQRNMLSTMMPAINQVMNGLISIFSGDSDSGLKMIEIGVNNLVNTISEKLPKFLELGTSILTSIVKAIIQNLPKLLESAGQIVGELIAGLINMLPDLVAMAPQLVAAIVKGIISALPHIAEAGANLVKSLLSAIGALLGNVLKMGKDIVSSVWEGIKSLNPIQWGRDLISNFIQGIKDKFAALKDSVKGVASTVKKMLGFSEPEEGPLSDFHTYAPDMMKLFAKGIRDNAHLVTEATEKAFNLQPTIASAEVGASARAGSSSAVNYGGFNFIINAAEGQDVNQIADAVMERIETVVGIRGAVFA